MTRLYKSNYLGIAAEYLVASELLLRGIYAQPTFGNMKKLDLLVNYQDDKNNQQFKTIEVKSKQVNNFPMFKGIPFADKTKIVVFVDFHKTPLDSKPDFYILNSFDCKNALISHIKREIVKWTHPKSSSTKKRNIWVENHPQCVINEKESNDKIEIVLTDPSEIEPYWYASFEKNTGLVVWRKNNPNDPKEKNLGSDVDIDDISIFQDKWEKVLE